MPPRKTSKTIPSPVPVSVIEPVYVEVPKPSVYTEVMEPNHQEEKKTSPLGAVGSPKGSVPRKKAVEDLTNYDELISLTTGTDEFKQILETVKKCDDEIEKIKEQNLTILLNNEKLKSQLKNKKQQTKFITRFNRAIERR